MLDEQSAARAERQTLDVIVLRGVGGNPIQGLSRSGDIAERVRQATEHELAEQTRLRQTDDFKEGVKAMAERRLPNFTGR